MTATRTRGWHPEKKALLREQQRLLKASTQRGKDTLRQVIT
jgi:hypothetical protein